MSESSRLFKKNAIDSKPHGDLHNRHKYLVDVFRTPVNRSGAPIVRIPRQPIILACVTLVPGRQRSCVVNWQNNAKPTSG